MGVYSPSPVPILDEISQGIPITSITAGHRHSCALDLHGAVWCWGDNADGQVAPLESAEPKSQALSVASPVKAVAAGGRFTCARTLADTIDCWGSDDVGQLGDGPNGGSPGPVSVEVTGSGKGLDGVVDVVLGASHACALRHAGTVACWGRNTSGQWGDGSMATRPAAVDVLDGTGSAPLGTVIQLAAGGAHTCAITQDCSLWCWGDGNMGQLGVAGPIISPLPTAVPLPPSWSGSKITDVALGDAFTCASRESGSVHCFGNGDFGALGPSPDDWEANVLSPSEVCPTP